MTKAIETYVKPHSFLPSSPSMILYVDFIYHVQHILIFQSFSPLMILTVSEKPIFPKSEPESPSGHETGEDGEDSSDGSKKFSFDLPVNLAPKQLALYRRIQQKQQDSSTQEEEVNKSDAGETIILLF